MESSGDKKAKTPKATKTPTKTPKTPTKTPTKTTNTDKKITLNSIIDNTIESSILDANIPDDLEKILQEINDSEMAMAIDESFASNISMQINHNMPIEEDMEFILKQIIDKEILEADEKLARELSELQNDNNHNILHTIDESNMDEESEMPEDSEMHEAFGNHEDSEMAEILEQIRKFEESEKQKQKKIENRAIREQQDKDYDEALQADMIPRLPKPSSIVDSIINSSSDDDIDDDLDDEPEPCAPEPCTPEPCAPEPCAPKSIEEIRKARLAFFANKS